MRMGDEGVQALEWIYGRLSADEGLADALSVPLEQVPGSVWPDVAPGDAPELVVVYSLVSVNDRPALGPGNRLATEAVVDVKAVGRGRSYDPLAPVARAIYAALEGRTNDPVSEGGVILYSKRSGGIQYPEQGEGMDYRHLGHTFQVGIN